MLFLVDNSFEQVKKAVSFPCRIAKYGEQCVVTTHKDHANIPEQKFKVIEMRGNEWDFDYKDPEWITLGLGDPAHLQHSPEGEFATFTDGVYCLSVRGEKITITA